ncbi:hypothetical protein N7462_010149 [Penicillium macrosclerotiorum]|uniref:uncharacterized protein n=1 Tax=Penicillium macrosclerotiorum TaxID=303699 RepID=UPI002548A71E|nr:uncharacterized protein N7462_010149 [Penicillium macrosclerotiorum]KAJ5669079.1 hypothetical protein N7462_010149 [Penicillium macrosclerotiorum]
MIGESWKSGHWRITGGSLGQPRAKLRPTCFTRQAPQASHPVLWPFVRSSKLRLLPKLILHWLQSSLSYMRHFHMSIFLSRSRFYRGRIEDSIADVISTN